MKQKLLLKGFTIVAFITINLAASAQTAKANIRYVSYSAGNDANDGSTWTLAKKTISPALAALPGGSHDTLYMKGGDTWPNPGTSDCSERRTLSSPHLRFALSAVDWP